MEFNEAINDLRSLGLSRHRARCWRPFMEKYHCDYVCEIGVQRGTNFWQMILHEPKLAVAVDSWKEDIKAARNDSGFTQEQLDKQYEDFKKLVFDKPFVRICRGYSSDVVNQFPDNYFDFIYIDADHTYEGCKQDLWDWYPRVKPGMIFCGHDYYNHIARCPKGPIPFEVKRAVDEFIQMNNIKTFAVLSASQWVIIKP